MSDKVPDSWSFGLSTVIDVVQPSNDSLEKCHDEAILAYYDPDYLEGRASLDEFRNYGPPPEPAIIVEGETVKMRVLKGTTEQQIRNDLADEALYKLDNDDWVVLDTDWDMSGYDPNQIGDQQFYGEPKNLPSTITNPNNETATLIIEVLDAVWTDITLQWFMDGGIQTPPVEGIYQHEVIVIRTEGDYGLVVREINSNINETFSIQLPYGKYTFYYRVAYDSSEVTPPSPGYTIPEDADIEEVFFQINRDIIYAGADYGIANNDSAFDRQENQAANQFYTIYPEELVPGGGPVDSYAHVGIDGHHASAQSLHTYQFAAGPYGSTCEGVSYKELEATATGWIYWEATCPNCGAIYRAWGLKGDPPAMPWEAHAAGCPCA